MIEKEAKLDEDRAKIARVIYNRLFIGMNLQIDATLLYGRPHGIPFAELRQQIAGPYNTYLNPGLPPTPIANPGRASIRAALNPAPNPPSGDPICQVLRRSDPGVHLPLLRARQRGRWPCVRGHARAARGQRRGPRRQPACCESPIPVGHPAGGRDRVAGSALAVAGDPQRSVRGVRARLAVRRVRAGRRAGPRSDRGDAACSGSAAMRSRCRTRPTSPGGRRDRRGRAGARLGQHRGAPAATARRSVRAPTATDSSNCVAASRRAHWPVRGSSCSAPGAAARSIVDALGRSGVADIAVVNRTDHAGRAAADLAATASRRVASTTSPAPRLLVNATSVGMGTDEFADRSGPAAPRSARSPTSCTTRSTRRCCAAARRAGAATIDGLGMLVHQAVLQQELWTGRRPEPALMRAAAETELARR